ncbi:peptide-methionine (R)-S-oxide reductase MsrB [Arenimonas alkanexedens]
MNRRTLLQSLAALATLPLLPGFTQASSGAPRTVSRLDRPPAYWRDKVSPPAYEVLFEEDTEAPFSSPLDKEKRQGTFVCAACQLPLFNSSAKFDSGTGWPSFTAPIAGHMDTKRDFKLIWPRTEYHCARCGGHQGHVFDDGPAPRGERWCNNGLALAFIPQGQALPELRG